MLEILQLPPSTSIASIGHGMQRSVRAPVASKSASLRHRSPMHAVYIECMYVCVDVYVCVCVCICLYNCDYEYDYYNYRERSMPPSPCHSCHINQSLAEREGERWGEREEGSMVKENWLCWPKLPLATRDFSLWNHNSVLPAQLLGPQHTTQSPPSFPSPTPCSDSLQWQQNHMQHLANIFEVATFFFASVFVISRS